MSIVAVYISSLCMLTVTQLYIPHTIAPQLITVTQLYILYRVSVCSSGCVLLLATNIVAVYISSLCILTLYMQITCRVQQSLYHSIYIYIHTEHMPFNYRIAQVCTVKERVCTVKESICTYVYIHRAYALQLSHRQGRSMYEPLFIQSQGPRMVQVCTVKERETFLSNMFVITVIFREINV